MKRIGLIAAALLFALPSHAQQYELPCPAGTAPAASSLDPSTGQYRAYLCRNPNDGTIVFNEPTSPSGVIAAESLGASPSASPSQNLTAIQTALNNGKEVTNLTPGTFQISGTLIINSNTRFRSGPNTRYQVVTGGGQGIPVLVNHGYNTYSSTTAVSLSWSSGLTFSVNWPSHGFACVSGAPPCTPLTPNWVWLAGSNQNSFNGIFEVLSITDANNFTVTAVIPPVTAPTGSATGKVADTNIVIDGGIFDWNYPNNSIPTNQLNATAIVIGVAEGVTVRNAKSNNAWKYGLELSAVRDYRVDTFGSDFNTGDIVKLYGPLHHGIITNVFGHNNDDGVSFSPFEPVTFLPLVWSGGGSITNVEVDGVHIENTSLGSCVAMYPHPTFILDLIAIKNVSCSAPTGGAVLMSTGPAAPGGYASNVFANQITLENVGCSGPNPCINLTGNGNGTGGTASLNVAQLEIKGLDLDNNWTSNTNFPLNGNSFAVVNRLLVDGATGTPSNWPSSGAAYLAFMAGTIGTIDFEHINLAPTGGNGQCRLFGITGTVTNVHIGRSVINCPNGTIVSTGALGNTVNYSVTDSNLTLATGLSLNSPSNVFASGNTLNGMTSGLVAAAGNTTISYSVFGSTLNTGSVVFNANGNTPTVASSVCDLAGNCTTSAKMTASAGFSSSTFANLPAAANGTLYGCSDCTPATNPCTGGGTGAAAVRQNGAWVCK